MKDDKGNDVALTQFESLLSAFVLFKPVYYQAIYEKILKAIECFIKENRDDDKGRRTVFGIFSNLDLQYKGYDSFEKLRSNFYLPAADTFIKLSCDYLLNFKSTDKLPSTEGMQSLSSLSHMSLFNKDPKAGQDLLIKWVRSDNLFSLKNRGVIASETCSDDDGDDCVETRHLGITEAQYCPDKCKNIFAESYLSTRYANEIDEQSFVAKWLRARQLPVIRGASGSTGMLMIRVFALVNLTVAEKKVLLFAQSMRRVAQGYHSLFECMMVAERLGFTLKDTPTLEAFYAQVIPREIFEEKDFVLFWKSDEIRALIADRQVMPEASSLEILKQAR